MKTLLTKNATQNESLEPEDLQGNSSNETSKAIDTETTVTHPLLAILVFSSIGILVLLVGFLVWNTRKDS